MNRPHGISTLAVDLDSAVLLHAVRSATHVALKLGRIVVVLGSTATAVRLCADGCCVDVPGVYVIVPDVLVVEAAANGAHLDPPWVARRDSDKRTCNVHRNSRAVAS